MPVSTACSPRSEALERPEFLRLATINLHLAPYSGTRNIILSLTTAYFPGGMSSLKRLLTNERPALLNGLICLTFQIATPNALCVVFNLIFSQISVTDVHLHSIVFTALDMPLPKLYAVSVIVDAQRAAHHYREPQQ
ncbi:hypothetical protein B0H14DRAFT_3430914 [Mycena olivaceomarginata]|nr:hypothetical protein B0H14DRAFT_3430914 [Mycena olivaceomarginata]